MAFSVLLGISAAVWTLQFEGLADTPLSLVGLLGNGIEFFLITALVAFAFFGAGIVVRDLAVAGKNWPCGGVIVLIPPFPRRAAQCHPAALLRPPQFLG